MLRAASKLDEARFFLRLLQRSRGAQPRARYYASATIAACRSVTWILQADLRSKHGPAFDSWWEERRADLAKAGLGFSSLRDARNTTEKTGAPLIQSIIRREFSDGEIAFIEFVLDPGHETDNNLRFNFRRHPPRASENPELHMKIQEEILRKMDLFGEAWTDGSATVHSVFGPDNRVTFVELVSGLQEYVRALTMLVDDAQTKFAV